MMQSQSLHPSPPADVNIVSTMQRFVVFWTLILYVGIALSVYSCYLDRPAVLYGWAGVGLFALIVAFCSIYHGLYLRYMKRWPMPFGYALIYAGSQTTLLWLLSHYNVSFVWLGYALLGHLAGMIPPRRWLLPITCVLALLAGPSGLYKAMSQGDWIGVGSLLFTFVIWLAILLFIHIMITQRYRLGALVSELQQTKQELEAQAIQTEELAALRERTRLAREMHDSLGHALVLTNVKLEAAQRLYAVDATRGAAELETTKALVRDTMSELRRSLANLRSPLPDADICGALQRLIAEVGRRSTIEITCNVAPDLPIIAPELVKTLWAIAREALTNAERHAAAQHVDITIMQCEHDLVLRVSDDGIGLKLSDLNRSGHYGIAGMRERAEALSGMLHIGVRPEGGTVVEARVPALPSMIHKQEQPLASI